MLGKLKLLLGIADNSKDELLLALLEQAEDFAINYTHNDDTSRMTSAIINMAMYLYNNKDNTGVQSESYADISFSYSSEYPDFLVDQLKSMRKVMVIHD